MADEQNPREWWSNDKQFPVEDWQDEVANGDTRLGYRDWVAQQQMSREDEIDHDDTPSLQDSGVFDHADPRNR